jgi:hypothetical protein
VDTQSYIVERLQGEVVRARAGNALRECKILAINGLHPTHLREEILGEFFDSPTAVLVTTDCMSEGIDLQQASNIIINYELTWNPNRLEQRIGRINRFGQPKPQVHAKTMVIEKTIDIDILTLLYEKIHKVAAETTKSFVFAGSDEVIKRVIERHCHYREQLATGKGLDVFTRAMSRRELEAYIEKFTAEDGGFREPPEEDLFYGNPVPFETIANRMNTSAERVGSDNALLGFLREGLPLYHGELNASEGTANTYQIEFDDEEGDEELQKQLATDYVTVDRRLGLARRDTEVVTVTSPVVQVLANKLIVQSLHGRRVGETVIGRIAGVGLRSPVDAQHQQPVVLLFVRFLYSDQGEGTQLNIVEDLALATFDMQGQPYRDEAFATALWETLLKTENIGTPRQPEPLIQQHLAQIINEGIIPHLSALGESRKNKIIGENADPARLVLRSTEILTATAVYLGSN